MCAARALEGMGRQIQSMISGHQLQKVAPKAAIADTKKVRPDVG
jgi:hypothetical protein